MAGCGNILPESVIGQLLLADANEASRKTLNVIFDVGRQALPGSRRLCLRQLQNKQGISEVQTGMASSSLLYPVDLFNTSAMQASRLQNSAKSTVTVTGVQQGTSLLQCPLCRFQPSVQKVVRIYVGSGEMFPVSGGIAYTMSSVQFVFLRAFPGEGNKPSIASCGFPIVVFQFKQYFADAEMW